MVCDSAFTSTQSINDLKDPTQRVCDENSNDVKVLGGSLIREYTRYKAVVGKSQTNDYAYGISKVRQLMQKLKGESHGSKFALSNADSYHYLAIDFYWTKYCSKGRPKIILSDFTEPQLGFIRIGISDAIDMVNVLLDASNNKKELFMNVYNKYFPSSASNRDDPDEDVMGWSSLSYMYLKSINMCSTGLPNMKLTPLCVSSISRGLRRDGQ